MTIRRLTLVTALIAALAPAARAQEAKPAAAPAPPTLSEAQLLKAATARAQLDAEQTKIKLAQANIRLLERTFMDLEAEFLATLKAPPGATWDWGRMVAVPPPSPPASGKP